ncbi:SamB protein [Geosmithia morbida]|uniref:MYND-type zinc finger protein samB n=1 Tax=Geosmithia morbida TaxID=1094350 RepID=A0A9P4YR96_9HYPO|nr:SamB protein [Geosmithia morbida]KAF4120146.1 SamB protein [Geosmithia morbida]
MREVNFSIPSVNKASVGITTALYDRRALDCTSTLPLINSLNHLAYLTTSSARIRDILTIDGGIERLVCILKQGRSKDMMGMWKWNLAFQCVVNIGVRGTETVRTRVVEADMVPVIATILDNYIKVIENCREKAEEAKRKHINDHHHRHRSHIKSSSAHSSRVSLVEPEDAGSTTARRQTISHRSTHSSTASNSAAASSSAAGPSTTTLSSHRGHDGASLASQNGSGSREGSAFLALPPPPRRLVPEASTRSVSSSSSSTSQQVLQPLAAAAASAPSMATADGFVRPAVRDADRLTTMAPFGPADVASQPTSPTTPVQPPQLRSPASNSSPSNRRRPSIRHQNSTTVSDDLNAEGVTSDDSPDAEMTENGEIQSAVGIQDITMEDGESMLAEASSLDLTTPTVSEAHQDTGTFNITHRSPVDSSVANNTTPTPVPQMGLSPNRPAMVTPPQPSLPNSTVPRYLLNRHFVPNPELLAVMPREEDILMSLQLLAYVSKYCSLRSYFQKSHLVPKLNIDKDLAAANRDEAGEYEGDEDLVVDEDEDEEYLLPNDFNLFPLVEKFTVRYHSTDMQYWAGVVMRNLCRKDDTRGGIRQCAYYQCGKWEEYTRQFAKCRRCRRTKYCSKECQKSAWAFHRHWCVAASSQ